jgi:hypothetical protein
VHAFVAAGSVLVLFWGVLRVITHPDELPRLLAILPWLMAGAAVIKAGVAIASFRAALARRLIGWCGLWQAVAGWAAFTCCGIALTQLTLPGGPLPVARPMLFLGAALLAPLARYPLATLAVDWNRHR